jgi:hypothetical protein
LTNRQANLYRGSAFPEIPYYDQHEAVAGKFRARKHVMEIREQVRQSLHAEDLNKHLPVEITPQGVRPHVTRAIDPIDLLPK